MADLEEGPGGPSPPYLDQTEARRAEKTVLETGPPLPPYLRIWMTPPSPYLKVWICYCKGLGWMYQKKISNCIALTAS